MRGLVAGVAPAVASCSYLADPVPLVHEVNLAEVFDSREHGEEPGIGVVELWARQRTASLSLGLGKRAWWPAVKPPFRRMPGAWGLRGAGPGGFLRGTLA